MNYEMAMAAMHLFMDPNEQGASSFDESVLFASWRRYHFGEQAPHYLNLQPDGYSVSTNGPDSGISLPIPVLAEEDYLWVEGQVDDEVSAAHEGHDLPVGERGISRLACYRTLRDRMWEQLQAQF